MVSLEEKQEITFVISVSAHELLMAYNHPESTDGLKEMIFSGVKQADAPDERLTIKFVFKEQADQLLRILQQANGIEEKRDIISIPSESKSNVSYMIEFKSGVPVSCTCPAFQYHPETMCKHMGKAIVKKAAQVRTDEAHN